MKKLVYIFCVVCAIVSCARMGSPDGGWYDDDPPMVVSSSPADQSVNVNSKKITIFFNEYIKLEDATSKVIVSPPQLEMPEIKASGKRVIVELQDSLKPNTTYTIDFSDAISDNNEGNPMGSFTYSFSTGEQIDTFEVSGYVLDASNLEPIKGISVGLYDDLADSAFKTKPMLRVSRSDSRGRFVIKGIAPGTYRAYALQDVDGDFRFSQKSEMIAFSHDTFSPSSKPDIRVDTVWRDSLHIDRLLQVPYTHFLPDDITLLAFTQTLTDRYLIKTERAEAEKFSMYFSYGHEELPKIKGLNFDADSAFVVETGEKQDTIHFWLRDTALVNQDTLRMEISYMMTDTLGNLVAQTDTLDAVAKTSYEKRQKALAKDMEQWQKDQDKRKKRGEKYDSIYPAKPLEVKISVPSAIDPADKIAMETPVPLSRCDTSAVHLYSKIDSLWYRAPFDIIRLDSVMGHFELLAEWQPGTEYSLEVDSAAFVDIYGFVSEPIKQGLKAQPLEELSSLVFRLSGVSDTGIVVQLLNREDKCLRQVRAGNDGEAAFFYLEAGNYYARAFVDRNGNDLWDTGNYDDDQQPEDVYYYSGEIECKAKWDVTKQWNLTGNPRNQQKPGALVKQKDTKEKKQKQNRNAERARQLGIEYVKKELVK